MKISKNLREVDTDSKIMKISAVTGQGIDELLYEIADTLDNYEEQEEVEIDDSDIRVVYKHEKIEINLKFHVIWMVHLLFLAKVSNVCL